MRVPEDFLLSIWGRAILVFYWQSPGQGGLWELCGAYVSMISHSHTPQHLRFSAVGKNMVPEPPFVWSSFLPLNVRSATGAAQA